ncbi:microsomal signal peptidase 25 kDa subunit-domain-containing protein [Zychaea mexicana]|uniref:microsomal signal peptidase 25 kDa subunit-domain-containing protein n=1 Tax=Zychaea mexicana TaxID=64656 RepID=UPI0022FDE751|nr:microsomal signal peptidase 25 kDa subunit-domain-containing protein [Zychaea mexicana]KAI9488192.1 microsomal signal peptidase 25 kDa subunit-domain-containing protein [Zychaea mexicana]
MAETKELDNSSITSSVEEDQESVEISNKYDGTQIKNAVDDQVRKHFGSDKSGYVEGHVHTDIKLLLGYSSCILAGAAFLFEYYTSFQEAKPVLLCSVIVFWLLQGVSWAYSIFVEQNEIFVGYKNDPKTRDRQGILTISSEMSRYSPMYTIHMQYQDQILHKTTKIKLEKNVSSWFTEDGVLAAELVDKDLEKQAASLLRQVHQD